MKKIIVIAFVLALTACVSDQKPVAPIPLAPIKSSVAAIQTHTTAIKVHADKAKVDIAANNIPAATQDVDEIEEDDAQAQQAATDAAKQIQEISKADAAKSAQMVAEQQKIQQLAIQEKNDHWYKSLDLWICWIVGLAIVAYFAVKYWSIIWPLLLGLLKFLPAFI